MLYLVLIPLILIVTFLIARVAGVNLWTWLVSRKTNRRKKVQDFAEEAVRAMLKDERVTASVYAQAQRAEGEAAYIFGIIAFFWGVLTFTTSLDEEFVWIIGLLVLSSTLTCGIGMWAMDRVDYRLDSYHAAIERYEQELHLPKRP
ncbi:MAG: hypothetical protein IT328_20245 [Caldilineaceae bacterium]|nr:hypothetical protein [Caldilineaceae bacterium]